MVDRIRYPTVSYLPFYYVFFQFLLLTIFNLQANILTAKDILSNLDHWYKTELAVKGTCTSTKEISFYIYILKGMGWGSRGDDYYERQGMGERERGGKWGVLKEMCG